MIRSVKAERKGLLKRYEISNKLARRVEALGRRKVGVTRRLLEACPPDSPGEQALTCPELLKKIKKLDDAGFAKVIKKAMGRKARRVPNMTLLERKLGKVIALPEELDEPKDDQPEKQKAKPKGKRGKKSAGKKPAGKRKPPKKVAKADDDRKQQPGDETEQKQPAEPESETRTEDTTEDDLLPEKSSGFSLGLLGEAEAETLFTSQDISRLKLVILTSTKEDEKLTAVRQLAMVPADPAEKGGVLLRALSDDSGRVRGEAANALVGLGLSTDIAEVARAMAMGNESQRLLAAQSLTSLVSSVAESEMPVVLTLLAGSLKDEASTAIREELISAARGAVEVVSRRKNLAAEMVRLLLDQIRAGIDELRRPVADTLAELGNRAPDVVGEFCRNELERIRDNSVRRFLLSVMGRIDLPEPIGKDLAVAAVDEILASGRPEEDCLELGSILSRWPEVSAEPMLEAIEGAPDAAKVYMVRLLDIIGTRGAPPESVLERIGEKFLRLMQVSEKNVRPALLLADVVHNGGLSETLRGDIAAEMLSGLREYGSVRILKAISASVERIGKPSIKPLFELLDSEAPMRSRVFAARVLGNTVASLPEDKRLLPEIERAIEEVIKRIDDRDGPRRMLAASLGKMCTNPLVGSGLIEKVEAELVARMKTGPDAYGVLEGLGDLALNPNTPLKVRLDIVQRFFQLLNCPLPEVETQETIVDDQRVYTVGGDVSAYTEMVPTVLKGLRNSFIGGDSEVARKRITRLLLDKWTETSTWETVWSPENVIFLLRVLGTIACHASTPMDTKLDIFDAISKRTDLRTAIETLGGICRTSPASKRLGAKSRGLAWYLMEGVLAKRSLPAEHRQACFLTLGVIGARTSLGVNPNSARDTRKRILDEMFEGLRGGYVAAAEALSTLKDCAALPDKTRKDIAARVKSFTTAHSEKVPLKSRLQ